MTIQKLIVLFILFFCNNLISQEISAQKYLELIEKQNQQPDGYYEGNLEILLPYKKKQSYDFLFLKKKKNIFWEFRQYEQIHFRVLCNQENQIVVFYDKRRDVVYRKKEEQILKKWMIVPYFLFCGILLESILDPQKIEKLENEILIRSKFFYPNSKNSLLVHFDQNLQLKKYIFFLNENDLEKISHRILFLYDYPIKNIKNNFPSRIEVIDAKEDSVAIFQWNLYYEKYKIDDIRFMPEFISR